MEIYQNPIQKHGDFADPFVLRFNGKYYLYCTNSDVRCWQSEDLVNWTLAGAAVPEDEFPGLVPFAPEVVYENGWFYMYTSPHGFGHYVLRSKSPTGPFRKITPNIGHAIDFSVFIDEDGQWYAYWADENGILGCPMASPTEFGEPQYIGAFRAACRHPLPQCGALEVHLAAASEETDKYGIQLTKQRLCISRISHAVQFLDGDDNILWQMALPNDFRHEALHQITLHWGERTDVFLDHLRLQGAAVNPAGGCLSYLSDGSARFGSVSIAGAASELAVPVSALVPAVPAFTLWIPKDGIYQCSLFEQKGLPAELSVDGRAVRLCQQTENLTTFRLPLVAGTHSIQLHCEKTCRLRFELLDERTEETLTAELECWDKQAGSVHFSNMEVTARLAVSECAEGWEAGVIFRAQALADGGEGNDKQLGTNFFLGYRAAVCKGKIGLWKHCYDETLLVQRDVPWKEEYCLTIRCDADEITVLLDGTAILNYIDAVPICTGYVGFHCRNCRISESALSAKEIETENKIEQQASFQMTL